jgi:hypothetical protein
MRHPTSRTGNGNGPGNQYGAGSMNGAGNGAGDGRDQATHALIRVSGPRDNNAADRPPAPDGQPWA